MSQLTITESIALEGLKIGVAICMLFGRGLIYVVKKSYEGISKHIFHKKKSQKHMYNLKLFISDAYIEECANRALREMGFNPDDYDRNNQEF